MTHKEKDMMLEWYKTAAIQKSSEYLESALVAQELLESISSFRVDRRHRHEWLKRPDVTEETKMNLKKIITYDNQAIRERTQELRDLAKPYSVRLYFSELFKEEKNNG